MKSFIEIEVEKIRATVGDRKVLCALSGGVDSSVVAALIHRAIGDQLRVFLLIMDFSEKAKRKASLKHSAVNSI